MLCSAGNPGQKPDRNVLKSSFPKKNDLYLEFHFFQVCKHVRHLGSCNLSVKSLKKQLVHFSAKKELKIRDLVDVTHLFFATIGLAKNGLNDFEG